MSTTITWQNPASGDWNTGTNWTGGAIPAGTDNAAIGLSGSYDVTIASGETEAIVSLAITNTAATLLLDGVLEVSGTLSGTGRVVLSSGTIAGGTIAAGSELTFADAYNYLAGVAVDGGLQVGGPTSAGVAVLTATTTVYAANGVSPGTITLGDNSGTTTNFGDIYFQNTRTIENFITAGGTGEALYIDAGGTLSGGIYPLATLTLGPQFVLQGGTGDTFTLRDNGAAVGYADVVNDGTINAGATGDVVYVVTQGFTNAGLMAANASGDVLYVENATPNAWANTGTISVSGGGNAYLGGSILAVGTLVHTGTGEIYITGTVENAGSTQDAAGSLGQVVIQGGTILGGTVLHGSDLDFADAYNYLAGVAVDGGLQVGGPLGAGVVVLTAATTVYAEDGVSPGTITLGDSSGTTTNFGDIYFQNTRTIENFITAGGKGEALYIDAGGTYSGGIYPVATLTLGPQFVLQGSTGDTFTFRDNGAAVGYSDLVNDGTINAGATGDLVYINNRSFNNAALLEANGPGDVLYIENGTANAWANTGTISVSGGGNAYLGGSILAVGTLVHTGTGEIYITGTVENAGSTQDAAGSLGQVVIQGGTILGGTVLHGSDLDFADAYNYLAGVAVDGGLQVGGPLGAGVVVLTAATTVYAEDGVSPGTITLGDSSGTTTNFGDIYFQNTRTIENFITAGGTGEALYIDAGGTLSGGIYPLATLTLGPQFVLQGGTGDTFTLRDNGAAVGYADVVNDGTINAGTQGDSLSIATQGFTNFGLVAGSGGISNLVNNGVVESTGALRIGSAVTGTGTLLINSSDALELAGAASAGQTVQFGGAGTLRLDTPTLFGGTLLDLQAGDTIDLPGTVALGATINGNLLAITLQNSVTMQPNITLDLALLEPANGITAAIEDAGTEVVIGGVTCFLAGTRIATPRGEVAVEDLVPGDEVLTIDGSARPVQWIGQREVACARHAQPWQVWPVRIAAHAFGRDCPRRPLFLSPDHAVFVEGVLIPAKHLLSGTAVRQVRVDRAHYYHIELPQHAVVLAEGLPVESYLDTGDRRSFANGGGVVALHPAWGSVARDAAAVFDALGAAPLHVSGPAVERALARLAARATAGRARR